MKEGYKKTELGWIPEEWKVARLSEISSLIDGDRSSKYPSPSEIVEKGILFLSTSNIKNNKLVLDDCKYITKEKFDSLNKGKLKNNDLIITLRGTIGSVAKFNTSLKHETGFINAQMLIIRVLEDSISTDYLWSFLSSDKCQNNIDVISSGSAQPQLTKKDLLCLKVAIPPLEEQQKIAEILSTVDAQIDDTDKLIEKTKELKKGLMQRLLTKGIGHSEFKKSEVGEIPVEWKVVKINDICEIVDYRGKTPQKVDKGIFLVTAKNIGKGYIDYTSSQEYIKESDYDSVMSRGTPEIGDVLFTTEAPLGNIANVDNINIALAQRVIKFRGDKDRLNNYYLKYYMLGERFQQDILHEATGSTVLGIKGSRLKNVLLAVPPLYEQEKIAHILTAVDNQISEYENEKIKLEELKKGLMQQLLTGKIRVV